MFAPPVEVNMKMIAGILIVGAAIALVAIAIRPRIARAALLESGTMAPPFSTKMVMGDQIVPISLAELRGKKVVLYFYPKDETPGCTKEACTFRDSYERFKDAGIVVLGCSVQSPEQHAAFTKKYHLPFGLLLDPDKKIATEYGAANGIPILGLDRRITYVIGDDGRIVKVYPDVDPSQHASQILSDLGVPEHPAAPAASPTAPPR
jgi:peroxiredoxin Q/BCP